MTARRRPDRMSPHAFGSPSHRRPLRRRPLRSLRPRRRGAAALGAAAAAVVLAGCGIFPAPPETPDANGNALPTTSAEGFVQLPLYFVALNGDFPSGTTGREVACQDLLVRATSVPVKTEDPVAAAIGFLLDDEQYEHGEPPLTNSLDPSEDGLAYVSSRVEGDTVTVELSGDVVSRGQCESFRLRAQLHRTAAAAANVESAEIVVDGVPLEDVLGLPPLELGAEITTPGRAPEPAEGDGAGTGAESTGAEDTSADPLQDIGDPDHAGAGQG